MGIGCRFGRNQRSTATLGRRPSDLQLADLHPAEREPLAASYGLGVVPEWRIEDFKARCHLVLPGR
jgi:hypothetical protein